MDATIDDKALNALRPKAKPYKTGVGGGLYLEVMPNGSKLWRLKYYFERTERKLSLGAFPAVTLAQAIKARDQARTTIKAGTDPIAIRKAERTERTQQRARAKAFRLVMSLDNALTIETPRQILSLTPEQTAAVRAFLLATPEGTSHAAD
ncbi:Arm DNA-binding domain-containing protein [Stutzerimonas stutzeri]|uniref:Arm DNA-binding domain-containing protein n=1 Tax=Stutzerimonas stutzeri TaxID=316 RepID=UPI000F7B0052|nr:Arm DNA-binding domain-containing protein [Stutzerimonas stutzeri]RRV83859.1 DUF4102 domain-containing protein [Stutzerimonas stutzeri]